MADNKHQSKVMDNLEKKQIAAALREYCNRYDSQNKAANSLKGVSSATVTQVLTEKWELISEKMWRNIASQVDTSSELISAETGVLCLMRELFQDAKKYSNVFALCGAAGSGKTYSARHFKDANRHVYLLQCNEFWNKKMFLMELLSTMGRDASGTIGEMMTDVIRFLKGTNRPLLILDEADKLNDSVLYFFITLYNMLEDCCGIVMCATSFLKKRIERGLKLNKKGYQEIYSRIGRRFVELDGVTASDVAAVCLKNGVTDRGAIKQIITDSDFDMRRVKKLIHAHKMSAYLHEQAVKQYLNNSKQE